MKTIFGIILTALLSFLLTQWLPLPWFTPIIIAFVLGITFAKTHNHPFLMGSLGVAIFWVLKAIPSFMAANGAFVNKWSDLFTEFLGFTITPILLLILTAVFGGLLGGLSALSGHLFLAPQINKGNKLRSSKSSSTGKSYKLKLN
ncbi:MAG: hypothetical protein R2753_06285 [Chitinophagales bacterium]